MSEYGPPTDDQVRAYYSSQSRTANWVSVHSPPTSRSSSRPPTTRSNSSSSSRAASRPRNHSLPPPPPGFKYAPASTPMVYKTESATYTVITSKSKNIIVTSGDGKKQSSHRHSTPPVPARQQTYPQTSHKHSSSHTSSSSNSRHHVSHHSSKTKEKPLLQRLFSLGSTKSRKRRNSTGGSSETVLVKW